LNQGSATSKIYSRVHKINGQLLFFVQNAVKQKVRPIRNEMCCTCIVGKREADAAEKLAH
jgi:hypothetical protein